VLNQVKRSCDHSLEQFDPRKLGHAVILCCTIHNLRGNDDQCPFDLVVHLRFYQTRDCRFPIIASICQPIGSKQGKIITCSCSVPPSLFNLFAPFLRCFLRWCKKKRGWVKELIFIYDVHAFMDVENYAVFFPSRFWVKRAWYIFIETVWPKRKRISRLLLPYLSPQNSSNFERYTLHVYVDTEDD